ncbi:hypothetical protein [Roseateles violae]|uniref:Lipoprotein n=1 Tax=Roseateles violae TaxID=3058042 RepID=A0ABT8DQX3_9BURK|nr:hypothetical protein [Pelomonas sp. PFR6]MDN3919455.1 hypothetical protein [Pelomonas sp. PFR6]
MTMMKSAPVAAAAGSVAGQACNNGTLAQRRPAGRAFRFPASLDDE